MVTSLHSCGVGTKVYYVDGNIAEVIYHVPAPSSLVLLGWKEDKHPIFSWQAASPAAAMIWQGTASQYHPSHPT